MIVCLELPCQEYRTYVVYIWFRPTLYTINENLIGITEWLSAHKGETGHSCGSLNSYEQIRIHYAVTEATRRADKGFGMCKSDGQGRSVLSSLVFAKQIFWKGLL